MEHFSAIIIGAGISGIGMACHFEMDNAKKKHRGKPQRDYVILEGRPRLGGTWDLFRYPGIRSDSDMYTFGFGFKPWSEGKDIASASSILNYLQETVDEFDVRDKIRFDHRVLAVNWDSEKQHWSVQYSRTAPNGEAETIIMSCDFLIAGTGYYNYAHGYQPDFKGFENYKGVKIHPQHWPEDLDYSDKKMVVIGSGATAVTLIPNLAKSAKHVTMLQRSPTYLFSRPASDKMAKRLRKIFSLKTAFKLTRLKNIILGSYIFKRSREHPQKVKDFLLKNVSEHVNDDIDIAKHFTPRYNPWDQRICLVPDHDFFDALNDGSASVVTDQIDHFTKTGIVLQSGESLDADIVVSATGLDLQFLGGIEMTLDGAPVNHGGLYIYKGLMFSGIPNMAGVMGYSNASWTLKADLTSEYVVRLMNHMDAKDLSVATPTLPEKPMRGDNMMSLQSGYLLRKQDELPKQGDHDPWLNPDNYFDDRKRIQKGKLEDDVLSFL